MTAWGRQDTLGAVSFLLEGVGFALLWRNSTGARIVGAILIFAGVAPWLLPVIRDTIVAERVRQDAGGDRHTKAPGLLKQGGVEQGDATDEARKEGGETGVRH